MTSQRHRAATRAQTECWRILWTRLLAPSYQHPAQEENTAVNQTEREPLDITSNQEGYDHA